MFFQNPNQILSNKLLMYHSAYTQYLSLLRYRLFVKIFLIIFLIFIPYHITTVNQGVLFENQP